MSVTYLEREVLRLNEAPEDPVEPIRRRIRRVLGTVFGDDDIPGDDEDWMEAGLDSLSTVSLACGMVQALKIDLGGALIFDFPTTNKLTKAVLNGEVQRGSLGVELERARAARGPHLTCASFTQLVGEDSPPQGGAVAKEDIYQKLRYSHFKYARYHRVTDGMHCVLIPAETVWVGDGLGRRAALANEQPCHRVPLRSFLMDVEPVSTGAYARFLNCVWPADEQVADWVGLRLGDPRKAYMPLQRTAEGVWQLQDGVSERWPMIMVSWYGANAYSLWANGCNWMDYREAAQSFLPTEAQWEYAARGLEPANFPWGDTPPDEDLLVFCPDDRKLDPDMHLRDFPLAPVNAELGNSPFGLRGMAVNVWQWCCDTYDPQFHDAPEASWPNAWNDAAKGPKSERGGSWVGPPSVARSSYRRGRAAIAKGRCLGFRCIGDAPAELQKTASPEDAVSTEANSVHSDSTSVSSVQ
uniref:Carrier domain-containing protein n=1 Tax=Alexandrium monilatum TaxID=311494 RepID=A0A7S4WC86_9DINO